MRGARGQLCDMHTGTVRLTGWNSIPAGYGAEFELDGAPWWLRLWFHAPFVDRFAYPVVVRRGYGWLGRMPGYTDDQLGPVPVSGEFGLMATRRLRHGLGRADRWRMEGI